MEGKFGVSGVSSTYREEYAIMLIDHLAQNHSFQSFPGRIDVPPSTVSGWLLLHYNFKAALALGQSKCLFNLEKFLLAYMRGAEVKDNQGNVIKIDVATVKFLLEKRYNKLYGDTGQIDSEEHESYEEFLTRKKKELIEENTIEVERDEK